MKTKVHRVVLCIVDHDRVGLDEIKQVIENARYPNRCISPRVKESETRELDWTDEHPLNQHATSAQAFAELFAPKATWTVDYFDENRLVGTVTNGEGWYRFHSTSFRAHTMRWPRVGEEVDVVLNDAGVLLSVEARS